MLQLSPNSDPISPQTVQLFTAWDAPHPWLWVHTFPGSTVFKDFPRQSKLRPPFLSHSPSKTHCNQVLVSKNTLHTEVWYAYGITHIYPHVYRHSYIYTRPHIALTQKCSCRPQSPLSLHWNSISRSSSELPPRWRPHQIPQHKNTGRQIIKRQCVSVSSRGLGQRLLTSLLQPFLPPLLARPGTKKSLSTK